MGRRSPALPDGFLRGQYLHGDFKRRKRNPCRRAFATDKVDEIIAKVREQGYKVTKEPADLELGGKPIRIAFFMGPVNEEIELFWEK